MDYQEIEVRGEGAVTTVTLNRPAALNAITPRMLDEPGATFRAIGDDEQLAAGLAYEEQTAYAIADTEERIGGFR